MDLSVIIISYNEAQYIRRAINSILNQDYQGEYEIIISDDGSTDGSVEIIKELSQQFNIVKYIINQNRNDGVFIPAVRASNTIKRALEISSGKYITLLSADDYYCSDKKYSKAISFLDKPSSRKYIATYTDFQKTYEDKTEEKYITNPPTWRSLLISNYYLHISTFVFRREVYDKGYLFDRYCSDVGMLYSICTAGKIKKVDGVAFCHYQREGSITHTEKQFEIYVLQLVFLQDVYNKNTFRFCSLCRFHREINTVFQKRNLLSNSKYQKIISYCNQFDNNFLQLFYDFDNTSILKKFFTIAFLFKEKLSFLLFKIFNRIYRLKMHMKTGDNDANL